MTVRWINPHPPDGDRLLGCRVRLHIARESCLCAALRADRQMRERVGTIVTGV
ncbi:hypothetical protein ADIMK_4095 [Marinobacterium lacunae]|uniref:Uncharacterized protein n=1 Tax=Marinobacterium lacunae TaxID=1232683 RepID=A0A081FTU3_9GAMM|nr:hypothetical protein ADIMK_4095 [Marinobacterium lacunae]